MDRRQFLLAAAGVTGSFAANAAQPCPPPIVSASGGTSASSSCGGAANALGALAAKMPAGTWAQLSVANQNPLLGVGSVSGTMIHYCNSMPWNPISKCIEIVGMDHNYGRLRYVRFVDASGQFELMADDVGLGTGVQHGYDHVTLNPFTGDLYYRHESLNTGTFKCYRKPLSSAFTFAALPTAAANVGEQTAIGTCWWSGPFSGGGAEGALMVFNSGNALGNINDGQITAFNPLTNNWFFNKSGMAPNYGSGSTYHSVMEYSALKNVAVYGGGNAAPNKLWRLNADGSFTTMPNVPTGKSVGIQRGNLVCDPVTGNFLLLSSRQLWELNPTGAGTWTQLTGSRAVPSGVGDPTLPDGIISCAIPDYGVIAYVKQTSQTGGTFFLYKHA